MLKLGVVEEREMEYIYDDSCLGRRCVVAVREGNQSKDARGIGVYRHTLFP